MIVTNDITIGKNKRDFMLSPSPTGTLINDMKSYDSIKLPTEDGLHTEKKPKEEPKSSEHAMLAQILRDSTA